MGACSYCDGVCKSGGDGMFLCCVVVVVVVVVLLLSLTHSHGLLSCRIV
jgi:hypothetical protein